MAKKIIVVDDEKDIADLIAYNLEQEGFKVVKAYDGLSAWEIIRSEKADLVVLDLMMPGVSGIELSKLIRASAQLTNLPIIMLTAKSDQVDKILGLELGADDYITKPFHVRELIARIRAVLRRTEAAADAGAVEKLHIEDIEIDLRSYDVKMSGKPIALSPHEFRLLKFFAEHPGRVYTRNQLLDYVWGDEVFVEPRTVDAHISRLRTSIEQDKKNPHYIQTVRGIGYKFADIQVMFLMNELRDNRPVWKSDTLAAIDIGTNSIHLIVAKINTNHSFEIIARENEVVRLGSGAKDMKYLQAEAMDRAIETIIRYRQIAEIYNAQIRAVATSAVREALNQTVFLEKARVEAGVDVEIISGFEEARLIYLGILQALPVYDKKVLLIDIGGGSTEFLVGRAGEVFRANSLKLGAVRLTDLFFKGDPIDERSIAKCRQHVKALLDPMARELRSSGFEMVVGSSGTILNLAQMIQVLHDQEPAQYLSNFTFDRSDFNKIIKVLVKADTIKKRQKIDGLDQKRADIIQGGAILLEQIFDALKFDSITVSGFALREGVILDTVGKSHGESLHHLSDIRYKGVLHLAETCRYERGHADQVARLALQIYDQLRDMDLHIMADMNREYLEAAAILHDIGFFISHDQHHRHGYYIIRNSEYLTGFTSREIEIIALVARYHRKSGPNPSSAVQEFGRCNINKLQFNLGHFLHYIFD